MRALRLSGHLLTLAEWLTEHQVTHVAMEATGVYWKPVWHVLEGHFTLELANATHIRNIPGRKSDINDARGRGIRPRPRSRNDRRRLQPGLAVS